MRLRGVILSGVLAAGLVVAATALAINLGDAGGVSYRYHAKHATASHPADSLADCPRGKSPTGGGYQVSSGMGFNMYEAATSRPFDGADKGRVPDDGSGGSWPAAG